MEENGHTKCGKHRREGVLHLIYKVQYDRLYSTRHLVADDRLVQSVFRIERAGRGVLRLNKLRGCERKRYDPA